MSPKREDKVYVERFRSSQEGHAVWPKVLSDDMQPGACGYFNGDGDWVTIVQLTDIEAVKRLLGFIPAAATTETEPDGAASLNTDASEATKTAPNLTALENITVEDVPGEIDWTEKTSEKIRRQELNLHAEVIPPGTAAGATAGIQYTCMTSRGAVLVARPPVFLTKLKSEVDLINWVNDNIEALAHKGHWPSIKKRGLWVIRKTYYSQQCAKTVFQKKNQNVTMHVGTKVPNLGEVTASAGWWNTESVQSGWTVHRSTTQPAEDSEADAQANQKASKVLDTLASIFGVKKNEPEKHDKQENVGVVMFFGGIWWRKRRFLSRMAKEQAEKEKQEVLGEEPDEPLGAFVGDPQMKTFDSDGAFLEFAPWIVGQKLPSDKDLPECHDSFEMYEEDDSEDDEEDKGRDEE